MGTMIICTSHSDSKECRTCLERKPMDEFHRNCKAKDGRLNHCKPCVLIKNRAAWNRRPRWTTPEHRRAAHLRQKYGLTLDQYDEMLAKQGGVCGVCHAPGDLRVDHDHATGKVRGLLCHSCNTALGHLRDSPEILRSAIDYLGAN